MTTVSHFIGTDVIAIYGGSVAGELADIKWKKSLLPNEEYPVTGTITCTVFHREPLFKQIGKVATLDLLYWAEPWSKQMKELYQFGHYQAYSLIDVEITSMAGGVNIDDLSEERVYEFRAKDVFYFPEYTAHPAEQDDFIGYMDVTRSVKTPQEEALYELYKRDQEWRLHNESAAQKRYDCERFMRKDV